MSLKTSYAFLSPVKNQMLSTDTPYLSADKQVCWQEISIIAVHGLNPKNKKNHAERTWESEGKLWLRDFLPKQLPRARILLYGYNSSVGFQSSAAGVREQAQNLLNGLWIQRKVVYYRKYLLFMISNMLM